jgi:hypothetical protein
MKLGKRHVDLKPKSVEKRNKPPVWKPQNVKKKRRQNDDVGDTRSEGLSVKERKRGQPKRPGQRVKKLRDHRPETQLDALQRRNPRCLLPLQHPLAAHHGDTLA